MLNCLKFHQIIHSMTRLHTSKYPVLAKNDILSYNGLSRAVNTLLL